MAKTMFAAAVVLLSASSCSADMYLHAVATAKGTNNRANEQNVNRNNNNRLWDSQNNNKGGYSIGVDEGDYEDADIPVPPTGPIAGGNAAAAVSAVTASVGSTDANPNNRNNGRRMQTPATPQPVPVGGANGEGYMEPPPELEVGSILPIEWTAQHACGPNDKTTCEVTVQYGCDVSAANLVAAGNSANALGLTGLRDGEGTGCDGNGDQCPPLDNDEDVNGDTTGDQFGQHETVAFYQDCRARERNKGLFRADQNPGEGNNARARKTRQNPNGGRSGTECAEERDYYPYWHPTPWRDIAVLTSNMSRCAYYVAESQNTKARNYCSNNGENNAAACTAAGGTWQEQQSWDALRAASGTGTEPSPICLEMFWSRDNHLGNGADGQPNILNWTTPSAITGLRDNANANAANFDRCTVRVRYNITTGDSIDPAVTDAVTSNAAASMSYWDLDSNQNGNASPVHQDDPTNVPGAAVSAVGAATVPNANLGGADAAGDTRTLQLALNTNQYGRTFEDRSLIFHLIDTDAARRRRRLQTQAADPKIDPATGKSTMYTETDEDDCNLVEALTIRGKRGNIVQSYPGVEHDFEPSPLVLETGDCVHMEFGLTDNDPPNNAGEGTPGTGRANFVLTETGDKNKPITNFADQETLLSAKFFESEGQMFRWAYLGQEALKQDNGNGAACLTEDQIEDNNNEQNIRNCGKINPRGPFYDAGMNEVKEAGTFHYMSTRENNFSNRSHKAQIVVVEGMGAGEIALITVGGLAAVGMIGAAGFLGYNRKNGKDWRGAPLPAASA